MIIDGHAHSAGEFHSVDGIVRVLDALGVDKVVLCPGPINGPRGWLIPDITMFLGKRRVSCAGNRIIRFVSRFLPEARDLFAGNAYVASLRERSPERIIQAYWIDPMDVRMREDLDARHRAWGFEVLKVHQCFHPFRCDGPEMNELARFAGEKGLVFFIHHYSPADAEALLRLAAGHRETPFVVAHLLSLDVFLEAGSQVPANLYFDISPPNLVPEIFIRRVIEAFGSGRVLMGSDTPFGKDNLKKTMERIRRLDISEDEKHNVLGGNLENLLSKSSPQEPERGDR